MAFLKNKSVNLLSAHYGFQALAQGSGGVFLLVFLLKSGLTVSQTLVALAATVLVRFVSRCAVLSFAKKFGLKTALLFGSFLLALQYPLSAEIQGVDTALLARCLASGIGEAFYWSCFHAYFASVGDNEHRGHQIGAREALATAIGIVAPILGAWGLVEMGPRAAFAAIGVIQAAGVLPLLYTPDVTVKREAPGSKEAAALGVAIYAANGWFAATFVLIWQVALFLALSESLTIYGGTMALAAMVGALGGLVLGRSIDKGQGQRTFEIVFLGLAIVAVIRAASLGVSEFAIAANALGAFSICFYVPTIMAPVYNLAKSSPCSLRFHIATENSWDIGCFSASFTAILLLELGLPLSFVIVLTLPSCLAHVILLRRYYRART